MYLIRFSKQAENDKKMLKEAGLEQKAKTLLQVLSDNLFQNPPAYEGLVGNLAGYYSRRISIQHRLVYQVYPESVLVDGVEYEGTIKVVRMWTQYDAVK